MNLLIKQQIDKSINPDVVRLYFSFLKRLFSDLQLSNDDERIALTMSSDGLFSFNLNWRLALHLDRQNNLSFLVNIDDVEMLQNDYSFTKEEAFIKQNPKAQLIHISFELVQKNTETIYKYWSKSCKMYMNEQGVSQYRKSHINEIYRIATDADLLEKYINSNVKLVKLIDTYKQKLNNEGFSDELFKWELLTENKGKPNLDADDFTAEMLSFNYHTQLLYPTAISVMKHIINEYPNEYKNLLVELYDEQIDLTERVNHFKKNVAVLYKKMGEKLGTHHDERTIATFLTYKNPDKYTFYKSSFYKKYCDLIGVPAKPAGQKYTHYLALLHDLIDNYIKYDNELEKLVKNHLPNELYQDSNRLLLAQDMLFVVLEKEYGKNKETTEQTTTNSSISYWVFQANPDVYDIFSALKDNVLVSWRVAQNKDKIKPGDKVMIRVTGQKTGIYALATVTSEPMENDTTSASKEKAYYLDDTAEDNQKSVRLQLDFNLIKHPFTKEQMTSIDMPGGRQGTNFPASKEQYFSVLNHFNNMHNSDNNHKNKPAQNIILYGPPGTGKTYELQTKYFPKYTTKETSISKEQHFENVVSELTWWEVIALALLELKKAKVPDIVENRWVSEKAKLSNSNNLGATIWGAIQNHTIEDCPYVNVATRQNPQIFNKTKDKYWEILEDEVQEQALELYDIMDSVIHFNPNPDKNIERYVFTTFHQSYAYEDFVEGIKPIMQDPDNPTSNISYEIQDGIFKKLCNLARRNPNERYAIFIDEINRGNISSIFGELITLIEPDKREGALNALSLDLPYSKKSFSVPKNIDIIGTMNTADRSVEALDTALRRRFSFIEMMPKYNLPELKTIEGFKLSEVLQTINNRIEILIDRDHTIGHSYFIGIENMPDLKQVFKDKILPLLQEYFYGDFAKIGLVLGSAFVIEKNKNSHNHVFATDFAYARKAELNHPYMSWLP